MTNPKVDRVALKDGREARKAGKPRVNPYEGANGEPIPILRKAYAAWFWGWDAAESEG